MRKSDEHRLAKIFKKAQRIRREEKAAEAQELFSRPNKKARLRLSVQLANL